MNPLRSTRSLVFWLAAVAMGVGVLFIGGRSKEIPSPMERSMTGQAPGAKVWGALSEAPMSAEADTLATASEGAGRDGQRRHVELASLTQQLARALSGDRSESLDAVLKNLTKACGSLKRSPCMDEVLASLDPASHSTLTDILDRLPRLQPHLSKVVQTTGTPMLDRIQAISNARAEILGAENARLLYGQQEAQLRAEAQVEQFLRTKAATMPTSQRLKVAESLWQQELQGYPVPDASDPNELARRYHTSLQLTLAGVTETSERSRLTEQVRAQFFPAEMVQQMAQHDSFDAQQQVRIADYQKKRAAVFERHIDKSPESIRQRDLELEALKRSMFPDSFESR